MCRAGTNTATWLHDLEILGESNAPLLDKIAWYGGNSGVYFDLETFSAIQPASSPGVIAPTSAPASTRR